MNNTDLFIRIDDPGKIYVLTNDMKSVEDMIDPELIDILNKIWDGHTPAEAISTSNNYDINILNKILGD